MSARDSLTAAREAALRILAGNEWGEVEDRHYADDPCTGESVFIGTSKHKRRPLPRRSDATLVAETLLAHTAEGE